jgi:hypothetical protein
MIHSSGGASLSAISAYLATATLAAGTITTSQPITLTQTWNDGAVTFTAFVVNATSTASAAASLLMDLQVASASKFSVTKAGVVNVPANTAGKYGFSGNSGIIGASNLAGVIFIDDNGTQMVGVSPSGLTMLSTGRIGWASGAINATSLDTTWVRDAADTIAQKNGNNNQTHRWYSTNAAYSQVSSLSETHTLAAAATSDTTIQFPANCIPLGVTVRVTTLITGCTTFDVGISGATTKYGTGLALIVGTTNASCGLTNPVIPSAATSVRFSAVGGGASFSAGVIRVTLHYISLSAPTS